MNKKKLLLFLCKVVAAFIIGGITGAIVTLASAEEPAPEAPAAPIVYEVEPIVEELHVEPEPAPPAYTEEELEMLAIVIYREAGSDWISNETRLMVGNVVMNRIADPRFPDNMYDVLTQPRQYGTMARDGVTWPSRAAYEEEAVERAYDCARRVLEGERLLPDDVIWQAEFKQGNEVVAYMDGLYFCRN